MVRDFLVVEQVLHVIRPLDNRPHVAHLRQLAQSLHKVEKLRWRERHTSTSLSSCSPFHDRMGMALFTLYE